MNTNLPVAEPVQGIILDTCIVQYTSDKFIGVDLLKYLVQLSQRGFGLAISAISIYELLSGTTEKQETDGLSILNLFKKYYFDDNLLLAASQLSTLYEKEKVPSQNISVPDKLIAATAVLTGSLVMTADINDYPRPFFDTAEEKLFFYTKKDRTNMRVIQLLRPNSVVINQRFSERPKC